MIVTAAVNMATEWAVLPLVAVVTLLDSVVARQLAASFVSCSANPR